MHLGGECVGAFLASLARLLLHRRLCRRSVGLLGYAGLCLAGTPHAQDVWRGSALEFADACALSRPAAPHEF